MITLEVIKMLLQVKIGDRQALKEAIEDAFPASRLEIKKI